MITGKVKGQVRDSCLRHTMETDTQGAYDNFMKTTGFDNTNLVPTVANKPPLSAGKTTGAFSHHYDRSNPAYAPVVPGMVPATKQPAGIVTPNDGLVPGHLPVQDQINPTLTKQTLPLPQSDLIGKPPFVANPQRTNQDWRSVAVGPETDRRAPGNSAKSMKDQGQLKPAFTGKFKYQQTKPDAAFPKLSKVEQMVAGREQEVTVFLAMATIVFMGMASQGDGVGWGFFAILFAAATLYSMMTHREKQKATKMGNRGPTLEKQSVQYDSKPVNQRWDTSQAQVYQPRRTNEADANPYPKPMDSMTDTATRLAAQGLDQSNVEGPRSGYWYKRGPTPGDRERVKDADLMRSAKQFNMNERELEEYMARLDGEAPDQFYRSHPYMPFSPFWEHRQQIDDASTVHGISTAPGEFNRKWIYKDPKIQQAGAKTMHTKEPPPGASQPIDKVHPWMEPKNELYSQPFDTDQYTEFMTTNDVKVNQQTAGRLSASRQEEDNYYRNMYGPALRDPDDLPEDIKPVPTSREGIAQAMKERQKKAAAQMTNQADRQMKYMQNAQGYGYTVVPPHPHNPPQVPPTQYTNDQPYPVKYSAPNQMPSPNLKESPEPDMVATAPLSMKAKANKEFASAFGSTTPTEEEVNEALANISSRR